MSNGRPLFAFAFRAKLWQALADFVEIDAAANTADFLWVHLNLADPAAQAWLHGRGWPSTVVETVAAPIQRGKLFETQHLIYGHLRDFRNEPNAPILQAGSLSVVVSRKLIVTGRRIPLVAIEELRRRVEGRSIQPGSPFGLITDFFNVLNEIGEARLQEGSDRLRAIESQVLKRSGAKHREEILELRRGSTEIARDMAYKRTAILDLAREHPVLFPADEFDRLKLHIRRYAALVEDAQDFADQCEFVVEEFRAQVAEDTSRNLYILTMISAVFLPATLMAGMWGMNVAGIPFSGSPIGFWLVGGLIAAAIALVAIVLVRLRFF